MKPIFLLLTLAVATHMAHAMFDPDGLDRRNIGQLARGKTCSESMLPVLNVAIDYSIDVAIERFPALQFIFTSRAEGGLALFAPPDFAFVEASEKLGTTAQALLDEPKLAEALVRYHIFEDFAIKRKELETRYRIPTALEGYDLLGGSDSQIEGLHSTADIFSLDWNYCKQVIYFINTVLLPVADIDELRRVAGLPSIETETDSGPTEGGESEDGLCLVGGRSLFQVISSTSGMVTWTHIIELAGLKELFEDMDANMTMFVPNDGAFFNLLVEAGGLEELLPDDVLAQSLVSYHIVAGAATRRQLEAGSPQETQLIGQGEKALTLRIKPDLSDNGGLLIVGEASEASVLQADIIGCSSVVHVIDDVLLPYKDYFPSQTTSERAAIEMAEEFEAVLLEESMTPTPEPNLG